MTIERVDAEFLPADHAAETMTDGLAKSSAAMSWSENFTGIIALIAFAGIVGSVVWLLGFSGLWTEMREDGWFWLAGLIVATAVGSFIAMSITGGVMFLVAFFFFGPARRKLRRRAKDIIFEAHKHEDLMPDRKMLNESDTASKPRLAYLAMPLEILFLCSPTTRYAVRKVPFFAIEDVDCTIDEENKVGRVSVMYRTDDAGNVATETIHFKKNMETAARWARILDERRGAA